MRGCGTVTAYGRTAFGNVAPLRSLGGPATGLAFPYGLAADAVDNELLVANARANTVTVYARTASGDTIPLRTLGGSSTGLSGPSFVAVTTATAPGAPTTAFAQEERFAANLADNSITVHNRTASGNAAPLRTISGGATRLAGPAGVAVDGVNDEVLVTNTSTNSITVYQRTASGNVAPLRTIAGPATGLSFPFGIAVDPVNDEVLVANTGRGAVTVYRRTASGNAAPIRTITGDLTGLGNTTGLALDTTHDQIVVVNSTNSITVHSRAANGNAAPVRTIAGAATQLSDPVGVALDLVNGEILIANQGHAVTVYALAADGNVAPLRILAGPATGLRSPDGVAVDPSNDELAVANTPASTITIYRRTATGDVAPLRTVAGALTGLSGPASLAATTAGATGAACPSTFAIDFGGTEYADCFRDVLRGGDINAGLDLGGTAHTALNVTGSGSGTIQWLTVYDATPATTADATVFGAQTVCADVLIERFSNVKAAGLVALLGEGVGKRGLALLVYDAGNTDTLALATVEGDPAKAGKLTNVQTVTLSGGIAEKTWYRVVMGVDPTSPSVTGQVFEHIVGTDPTSALGAQVGTTLVYHPAALPAGVSRTGETGLIASAIGTLVNSSVTNFSNDPARCAP